MQADEQLQKVLDKPQERTNALLVQILVAMDEQKERDETMIGIMDGIRDDHDIRHQEMNRRSICLFFVGFGLASAPFILGNLTKEQFFEFLSNIFGFIF